jgi:hypothetical protein
MTNSSYANSPWAASVVPRLDVLLAQARGDLRTLLLIEVGEQRDAVEIGGLHRRLLLERDDGGILSEPAPSGVNEREGPAAFGGRTAVASCGEQE